MYHFVHHGMKSAKHKRSSPINLLEGASHHASHDKVQTCHFFLKLKKGIVYFETCQSSHPIALQS